MVQNYTQVFSDIYENCVWGDCKDPKYKGSSGLGSDVEYNIDTYYPFLRNFIVENKIASVVDLGCGDFRGGKHIYHDLDVSYHGYDAYAKVVEHNSSIFEPSKFTFTHLDLFTQKEQIESGELCIIKDVLQHWPTQDIYIFLDYLIASRKFKYIMICSCCQQQSDDEDAAVGSMRPLSVAYYPLKKYKPTILSNFHTKEVSVIKLEH